MQLLLLLLSSVFSFKFLLSTIIWASFVRKSIADTESCLQSNVSYTLCSSNGNNITVISPSFSEAEFVAECHGHFVEEVLNKSCETETITGTERSAPTTAQRYGYGFLAVFIVSVLSLAGLLAFPFLYKVSFQYILALFIALAVGTLLGDAMFHLIPYAVGIHSHGSDHNQEHRRSSHDDHDHDHDDHSFTVPDYQWKLLLVVLILYAFYLLEIFLHSFAHHKHNDNSSHSNAHNHSETIPQNQHSHRAAPHPDRSNPTVEIHEHTPIDANVVHRGQIHNHTHHNVHQNAENGIETAVIPGMDQYYLSLGTDSNYIPNTNMDQVSPLRSSLTEYISIREVPSIEVQPPTLIEVPPSQSNNDFAKKSFFGQFKTIQSTAWMVLIGDGIHNFADGLAIGAAFSEDLILGLTTTIAVGCHELPHELGDYAVLIQSGFTHYQALFLNFLSATTAIIGFFVGVTISTNESARQWIFAVTIGMFLYIALVNLLPTLLCDGRIERKRFILVNIGFLIGITIMFILAILEDKLIQTSK